MIELIAAILSLVATILKIVQFLLSKKKKKDK